MGRPPCQIRGDILTDSETRRTTTPSRWREEEEDEEVWLARGGEPQPA